MKIDLKYIKLTLIDVVQELYTIAMCYKIDSDVQVHFALPGSDEHNVPKVKENMNKTIAEVEIHEMILKTY
jgi:hypothetical protein